MSSSADTDVVVFLTGDVMTGRGIDQILPHPGDPTLRESVVSDARTYVALAERTNGSIPAPVDFAWPWGDAVAVLDQVQPDVRLINLETSITTSGKFAPGKAVHYRMHPDNIGCLAAIRPDVCALANNHVLDFGHRGLADTLEVLTRAEIGCAGVGSDVEQANEPVKVPVGESGQVVIASVGSVTSGIPARWAATGDQPGVALLPDLSGRTADAVANRMLAQKHDGDITIASVHWGSNWGYEVELAQIRFAHRLIDEGVDVVHGHSSHHPRPIEVYRGKLILYGCGDTVDDYEGIGSYEAFRHELRLLYFASIDRRTGRLTRLRMTPMRMRRMRLERAPDDAAEWLRGRLEHMSRQFGTAVRRMDANFTVG
ncbi:CapA family protein [Mycolicibacterium holsaticum]|nr:CapA family protein [Mycolicibacterium holsaticum]